MSVVSASPAGLGSAPSKVPQPKPAGLWIFNRWIDASLILLTPLLAAPAVLILYSSWVGIEAETISLIVTAFFATGHHLPGLIRAYGDRELFERFRWRFLLAPPLIFLAYFPLYTYHYNLYRLIILAWATWHGLMQVYGFARIYDAKVGSVSRATASWDWWLCLCGFITPQLFRPDHVSNNLAHWYTAGGPLVPAWSISAVQWGALPISAVAVMGFCIHNVRLAYRGTPPSPIKLMMLLSGIGMWCFVMLGVENLLLSVAVFDICHDIQYLAIVWMFNCRRVNSNATLSKFMKYVFRRGMVLLYLGLICAYGAIAFTGDLVLDGTVSRIFYGVLFTSTVLHYYYDGFIWKVREPSMQASLGLTQPSSPSRIRQMAVSGSGHILKWSPAVAILGLLFLGDLLTPPLTTTQKAQLERLYSQSLMGKSVLPPSEQEKSWLFSQFQQSQQIAATVPNDRNAQLRAAIMLANFGKKDEATALLEKVLQQHPAYSDGEVILGGIQLQRGNLDKAGELFRSGLSHATNRRERSSANIKLGELALYQGDQATAEAHFQSALKDNPQLQASIDALRKSIATTTP